MIGLGKAGVATVLVAALLGTYSAVAAQAQNLVRDTSAPSMANVTDVTGGMNYLLQNDDLMRLQINQNGNTTTTSIVTLNTTGSQITSSQTTQLATSTLNDSFDPSAGQTASEAVGRMYSNGNDVVALLTAVDTTNPPTSNDSWTLTLFDPLSGFQVATRLATNFRPHGTVYTQVLMGDFKGDNLVEPLIFYTNHTSSHIEWGMKVLTATDTTAEGPPTQGPDFSGEDSLVPLAGTLVVSDFNGDGRDEIAALLSDYKTVAFYSVDPKSLTITQITTVPLQAIVDNGSDTVSVQMRTGQVAMTAGRFRNLSPGVTNADLVVFGQIDNLTNAGGRKTADDGYSVIPILLNASAGNGTFTATVTPQPNADGITPFFRFPDYHGASGALAQAAQFENWPQQNQQQLLLGIQTMDGASYIEIGDFKPDQSLDTFRWYSETERSGNGNQDILANMWVGNFDNLNQDGSHNPHQQIETLEYQTGGVISQNIYERTFVLDVNVPSNLPPDVTKPGNWLSQHSQYQVGSTPYFGNNSYPPQQDVLIPGDVQGRSLRLGSPTISRIDQQKQLDLILATPPMHVDYVATHDQGFPGCPDPTTPCVMNISVRPSLNKSIDAPFTTTFNFSSSSMNQSQQSTTTGWGIATMTKVGESFTFNDGEENASGSIKDTTKTAHDESVKKAWGNYQSKTTSVEATTGLTDHIFDTTRGVNVYYYPVLGCETNQATCYSQGSNPSLYVEFSVPDQIHTEDVDGATQDWYQPVHEPGNVLSYPWDQAQLQAQFTGQVNLLTQAPPTCMAIGAGTTATSTTWAQGQNASSTSGSSSTFSNELSMSYSAGVGVKDVDSADINFSASVTTNTSLYNLNESSTSLQESKGITLTIPSFTQTSAGSYGFGQTIFGLQNTVNKPSENACFPGQVSTPGDPCVVVNDPNGKPIQVVGTGPLFTGYLADPLGGNSAYIGCGQQGAFWQNIYTQPDVALNHAERWTWSQSTETVSFNKPDQSGTEPVQDNLFYHMKGFFITAKGTPSGSATPAANALPSGPNLVEATPEDSLILTTRVYNYSLVDTNAVDQNSIVKVRFYGQLYCGSDDPKDPSCQSGSAAPCSAGNVCGNSFQIGQDQTIPAIAGFRSYDGNDAPNWALSSVEFDPGSYAATKNGNVDMVFWVVVWMQDSSGKLVAEIPDHGLTSIPDPSVTQITNVAIQAHSNNVGMYGVHQQFHILPPGITPPGAAPVSGSLANIALSVRPQLTLDQQTPLTATLQATGSPVGSVTIAYYDGDTRKSGSLLDVQNIISLQPGVNYTHRAIFTPKTCGLHTLYASAWLPNSPNVTISSTVNVTLQPVNQIQAILNALQTMTFTDQQTLSDLTTLLKSANQAYQQGQTQAAETLLSMFLQEAAGASGKAVNAESANTLVRQVSVLFSCGASGFALSALPDTATVSSGTQATYALAVTPSGGFAGNVALTCTGAPQGSMCSVSTPSVTLDGTTQAPLTVTVTTTPGAAMAGILGGPISLRSGGLKSLPMILAGLLAMALLWRARLSSALVACVIALIVLGGTIGCGSGSSSSGGATPAGTYTLTVQGASGKTLGKTTLTLVVQ